MVSLVIVCLLLATVYKGTAGALWGSMETAQHVAAFGLCRDRFEQMRGGDFSAINVGNYPTTTVRLTHMGGFTRTPVTGTFSNTITLLSSPARKQVNLGLAWTYRGRNLKETLSGCIVDRKSTASLLGTLTGYLYLNPNGTAPERFTVTLVDGSTLGYSNIVSLSQATSSVFRATHVRIKVAGSDTQTTLQYNYQPFPMANSKQWDLDASTMRLSFRYYPAVGSGTWRMRTTAQNALISCQ